ncbi:MAG: hypothetical protein ACSHX7_02780 [Luteolibacter sp.]
MNLKYFPIHPPIKLSVLPKLSDLSAIVCLFACGFSGLAIASLIPENESARPAENLKPVAEVEREVNPDKGLAKADLGKLVEFCAKHTTSERGFVIFRNGSCVLVRESADDPVVEAMQVLQRSARTLQLPQFLKDRYFNPLSTHKICRLL